MVSTGIFMDKEKALKVMKILAIILGLIFLFLFLTLPKTDCGACSLRVDGKKISFEKMMDKYFEECINNPKEFNLSNVSSSISLKDSS